MDASVLYPPNNTLLSDSMVCNVKLRAWPPQPSSTGNIVGGRRNTNDPLPEFSTSSPWPPTLSLQIVNKRSNLERQRSRRYQAKYRQKRIQVEKDLQMDIQRLQKEIKKLDYRQLCASTTIPTEVNVWAIALEYFRIFRHGFRESSMERSAQALGFLQKSMSSDVSDGYLRGPKALLRNWVLFSFYFDDIHVELQSMENITEDTLVATTTTSITISRNTLRLIFPHMNSDGHGGEDGGTWSPLAKRLEGQRLVIQSIVRFDWDSISNRVISMFLQSDMLTPMLAILDTLSNVSLVFERAKITPDFRLVPQKNA